jgi:predicted AlkP superfamily pyrophosphatase or phosphodiesterase
MKTSGRKLAVLLLIVACICTSALGSAYNGQPKVVVVIVVDQLRADMLERFHDQLAPQGFRTFLDHGAWYKNCYFHYANTETAPGHATLGTGAYTLGHGIMANEWFDPVRGRVVTSVEDDSTSALGADLHGTSASPRNLQTDTIGDELKLATGGQSRVFGLALKDRAAILPVGFSADAAYWIDHTSGAWITSSYYMKEAPSWVIAFNKNGDAAKYLNQDWKASNGALLRSTKLFNDRQGKPAAYYDLVGPTPFANDYTLDFARALIENEKVGTGPSTDLLVISFSSHDILGHKAGPDSVQEREMVLALDRQIGGFIDYLKDRFGLQNVLLTLTADHGVAPMPDYASRLRIPAYNLNSKDYLLQLNSILSAKLGRQAEYVVSFDYPKAFLSEPAFTAIKMNEADAERFVGEMMKKLGIRGYVTKSQLAAGDIPNNAFAEQFRNSYSPLATWYVFGYQSPFLIGSGSGTGHGSPYSYDAHVPLVFYGSAFKPGIYDQPAEPIDLAVTLSEVLGVNKPASASGHVRWESLAKPSTGQNSIPQQ